MYRNLVTYTKNNTQYVWLSTWDSLGNRVLILTAVLPYLYYLDRNNDDSPYRSIFDKPLRKMIFQTDWLRSEWAKRSANIPLFEKLPVIRQYLLDKYFGMLNTMLFSQYPFRIFNIDIEVLILKLFPDQHLARYPINVISVYNTLLKLVIAWAYKKNVDELLTDSKSELIIDDISKLYDSLAKYSIRTFDNLTELLKNFINYWTAYYPDVVSGWNTKGYDIPYLVNRITSQLGEAYVKKLSPVMVKQPIYKTFDKKTAIESYGIQGVTLCDYLPLYKKFAGSSKQSFKLDAIAKQELNIGKFDYYDIGYESIELFMKKDFPTFVKYNIIDTVLVRLLDKKLGFITLMRNICNISLCEYLVIFKSMPYILSALTIQARMNNKKFLTDANKDMNQFQKDQLDDYGYTGAFVFPTKAGYYSKGIMSFDFNSLYPSVMMTVNISPDTKVGKLLDDDYMDAVNSIRSGVDLDKFVQKTFRIRTSTDKIKLLTFSQLSTLLKLKCTLSGNGVLYLKPALKFGIVPQFLDRMYKQRVQVKNLMKGNKKQAKEIELLINSLKKQLELITNEKD